MNLLGIDVGTTGCKVALFSPQGEMLAVDYREYNFSSPYPGWAELDSQAIWECVKGSIRAVTAASPGKPVAALSVSSLGESVVPVTNDRRILGPSLLNFDVRGEEFLPSLAKVLPTRRAYAINGNSFGNNYTLTKLKWIQAHQPELYERTYQFLYWSSFIAFMLGAEPVVDYSLANRSLLFDIHACQWSESLLKEAGLDGEKLAQPAPTGQVIGSVPAALAAELGLPSGVQIINGAHDQCANAVGCGVIEPGSAAYGMGTYHCITPVFTPQPPMDLMIERGLNTEHHAVPDRYVCFIYTQGGSLVKWYRDTFAAAEHRQASAEGRSVYPMLLAEMPEGPSSIVVLPHFAQTGPPAFIADSCGVIAGLHLKTSRGEILKGIIEGLGFYLKAVVDSLPPTGIRADDYRVVGGGSKSDRWVQTCADIFGKPFTRPLVTEAGALGAAITAGVGCSLFATYREGVEAMIHLGPTFEPDPKVHAIYQERYTQHQKLWPLMSGYLREISANSLLEE